MKARMEDLILEEVFVPMPEGGGIYELYARPRDPGLRFVPAGEAGSPRKILIVTDAVSPGELTHNGKKTRAALKSDLADALQDWELA